MRRAITSACAVLGLDRDAVPMDGVCSAVRRRLPNHVGALHEYTDKTLALKPLMVCVFVRTTTATANDDGDDDGK